MPITPMDQEPSKMINVLSRKSIKEFGLDKAYMQGALKPQVDIIKYNKDIIRFGNVSQEKMNSVMKSNYHRISANTSRFGSTMIGMDS